MKSIFLSALRAAAFAAALICPVLAGPNRDDLAADLLHQRGTLTITNAGPHVSIGTFRVQVAAKLGQPDFVLADGTWLYRGRQVAGSEAAGTLVIRFGPNGRVSSLALATPAVVTALRVNQRKPADPLLATK